jgi:hypothetical protein
MVNEDNLRFQLEAALAEAAYWKEKYYNLAQPPDPKPTIVPVSFGDIDPDCNACMGTGSVDGKIFPYDYKDICSSCDGTGILSYKSE